MKKEGFLGLRIDEDTLKFIKDESNKAKKTMSEWIRDEIKKEKKKWKKDK